MQKNLAIEASGLVKSFKKVLAVDSVDLSVRAGGVYGLLGPNGAGKTTIIRMLATLLRPSAGVARVFGHDIVHEANSVRKLISLTGQLASVDEDLTGIENLILLGRLLGHSWSKAKSRAMELLEALDLKDATNRKTKNYSGGMIRRLDIAASIITTPALLFLDEPTTGLDPRSRNYVWEIVRNLVAGGTTILLTTQNLEEADQLADRIAVIDHGKIVAEGTSGELKSSVGSGALHIRLMNPELRQEAIRLLSPILNVPVYPENDPLELSARISEPERVTGIIEELTRSNIRVVGFSFSQPSLDEVFLTLTGHKAESDNDKEIK